MCECMLLISLSLYKWQSSLKVQIAFRNSQDLSSTPSSLNVSSDVGPRACAVFVSRPEPIIPLNLPIILF